MEGEGGLGGGEGKREGERWVRAIIFDQISNFNTHLLFNFIVINSSTHEPPLLPAAPQGTHRPIQFGNAFALRSLSWEDFPGEVEVRMPWSAHIYWSIDYRITDPQKGKLTVNLVIAKRSWVREEKKCDHLLGHEQGHYLIGGLCALEFLRRVDSKKGHSMEKF